MYLNTAIALYMAVSTWSQKKRQKNTRNHIHPLHGLPFAGRASKWQLNKLGRYITMYSPIVRSVFFKRRNRTIVDLLGNVFIHNAARLRLSSQIVEPRKERIASTYNTISYGYKAKNTTSMLTSANHQNHSFYVNYLELCKISTVSYYHRHLQPTWQ